MGEREMEKELQRFQNYLSVQYLLSNSPWAWRGIWNQLMDDLLQCQQSHAALKHMKTAM